MLLAVTIAVGLAGAAGQAPASYADVVTVGEIPAVTVVPGDTIVVDIPVQIADGFHVMANPAGNEFLIPLEVTLEPADSIGIVDVVYPEPETFRLEGTTEDLPVYHGAIVVSVIAVIHKSAPNGPRNLDGVLRYQACDSQRCLFPDSTPVRIPLNVAGEH